MKSSRCPRCRQDRPDFNGTYCPDCRREYNRAYYRRTPEKNSSRREGKQKAIAGAKAYVLQYLLTHPCVDCGEEDTVVPEFDHVTGNKLRDVGSMARAGWNLAAIQAEIAKCEVRCANCHRRVTAHRRNGRTF
ncbi:hypothetical protein AU193_19190 [Mycobacterium sp. GA-1285]|uniref:hypothetical protein n=1 Tax=Mycobacterium sp. GA-1285 TaxID=1772282 RepID=UPI000747123A|nr:hypothetical protein [Mycobacterium sp. GA-1285]KUI11534.1 hypothetical protein AU193_19190 [Mycobacterium sp. GA-1285]